jgi:nucleoside-diphosphate-sugar epimerase
MNRTSLVLGATGTFGGGVATEMIRRGWTVRAVARDPAKGKRIHGEAPIEWIQGDVQDPEGLRKAAEGASVVAHGVNYPYDRWIPAMETATANIAAAAEAAGATVLFAGNVYNLGDQPGTPLTEDAPHRPHTKKGKLRERLERFLEEKARAGGIRVLVVRAGDYYGPKVRNGLVDPVFGSAARGKGMQTLGNPDIPHQWAYIPDVARASMDLLERDLEPFEVVHFEGHLADPNRAFLQRVAEVAGHPGLKIRPIPWWVIRLMGLGNGVMRELLEMRYLFYGSIVLDGARLRRLLPEYRDTPVDETIRETLAGYR